MDRFVDVGHVAETLPDLTAALADPRLRRFGLTGGVSLVGVGALLSLAPTTGGWAFWSNAVAATLVFIGVPLLCLGLAAPDPDPSSLFHLGIDLTETQRRAVAAGSLCVTLTPIVLAVGTPLGLPSLVLVVAATSAVFGTVLILTGFVAWTAATLAEPTS
ncbi:hypothetical protein ACOZ4I_11020 [Haloarcula salina]|uniref:hypothetical protein n=1 Tax=Haloarcula salina TaxID=1429914 RepID=UPI003C7002A8